MPVTLKLSSIVTKPPAESIVKLPDVVSISFVPVIPIRTASAVTPAKVGESPVSNPKSIVEPATPFIVSKACPWSGLESTDADTKDEPAKLSLVYAIAALALTSLLTITPLPIAAVPPLVIVTSPDIPEYT